MSHMRGSSRRACLLGGLLSGLASLGCGHDGGTVRLPGSGSSEFGEAALPTDGGTVTIDIMTDGASPSDIGPQVRLRVAHGLANVGRVYACHTDAQLIPIALAADAAVELAFEPGTDLGLVPDGGLGFGEVGDFHRVPAMTSGTITLHLEPLPVDALDAGLRDAALSDAEALDADITSDASGTDDASLSSPDASIDASSELDATLDAAMDGPDDGGSSASEDASSDAGTEPSDGSSEAPPPRCGPDSLVALLPLPTPETWMSGVDELDAGAGARPTSALRNTAAGNQELTLMGSGLLLDPMALAARARQAKQAYLHDAPDDVVGADAAYIAEIAKLDQAFGPRFLLNVNQAPAASGRFSLDVTHLVPDVPPAAANDASAGALRICITEDSVEGAILDPGTSALPFRGVRAIANDLRPGSAYRFRFFVEADFLAEALSCATTSLAPVAELNAAAGTFSPGHNYLLLVVGLLGPENLCSTSQTSLTRAPCAAPVDQLRPRVLAVDDQ